MPKFAQVVFNHAQKAGSRLAGGAGSALRSFVEEAERTAGRPGPPIKVEPFGPGTVTTGAIIAKLATSVYAAARERANYAQALSRQTLNDDYRRTQTAVGQQRLAEPKYSFKLPSGETVEGLSANERVLAETRGSAAGDNVMVPTPDVVKKALGDKAPAEMSLRDAQAATTLYGAGEKRIFIPGTGREWPETSSIAQDYFRVKAGLPGAGGASGGKFDPRTEAEINAERMGGQAHNEVVARVKGLYAAGQLKDANGGIIQPDITLLAAGVVPPAVLEHPEVVAADLNERQTRGRNILAALTRADDFESLTQAASLFYQGDPLIKDPLIAPSRRAAILGAAKAAKTKAQASRVRSLMSGADDPLLDDDEIGTILGPKLGLVNAEPPPARTVR